MRIAGARIERARSPGDDEGDGHHASGSRSQEPSQHSASGGVPGYGDPSDEGGDPDGEPASPRAREQGDRGRENDEPGDPDPTPARTQSQVRDRRDREEDRHGHDRARVAVGQALEVRAQRRHPERADGIPPVDPATHAGDHVGDPDPEGEDHGQAGDPIAEGRVGQQGPQQQVERREDDRVGEVLDADPLALRGERRHGECGHGHGEGRPDDAAWAPGRVAERDHAPCHERDRGHDHGHDAQRGAVDPVEPAPERHQPDDAQGDREPGGERDRGPADSRGHEADPSRSMSACSVPRSSPPARRRIVP